MTCNCIEKVDAKLAEHNVALVTSLFGEPKCAVEVYKVDAKKRGKPPVMMASYCPFCGESYASRKAAAA